MSVPQAKDAAIAEALDRLEEEEYSYLLGMIGKHPNRWRDEVRKAWDDPREPDPRARRIRNWAAGEFHLFNEKNILAAQARLAAWKKRVAAGEYAPTRTPGGAA